MITIGLRIRRSELNGLIVGGILLRGRLIVSVIESRMSDKHFIGGSKVSSSKKRGGHHNRGVAVNDDSIYDFVNLRYRDDIERFRRGGCRRNAG